MQDLIGKKNSSGALINFYYNKGHFEFKGNLTRSDMAISLFNHEIWPWLNEYVTKPQTKTQVDIYFKWICTAGIKLLLQFFKTLEPLLDKGKTIKTNWYYHDEEELLDAMFDEYQYHTKIPIEFVKIDHDEFEKLNEVNL